MKKSKKMKLINPSFEILEQGPGLDGIYEAIERAGRTCYKSTRPEGQTAKDFVDRMIASQHYAMLEHGAVYLLHKFAEFAPNGASASRKVLLKHNTNSYSRYDTVCIDSEYYEIVTTNYRVLVENGWLDDLQYLSEPTEYHEKRVTVRFTTDRGVSHEFVRHKLLCVA